MNASIIAFYSYWYLMFSQLSLPYLPAIMDQDHQATQLLGFKSKTKTNAAYIHRVQNRFLMFLLILRPLYACSLGLVHLNTYIQVWLLFSQLNFSGSSMKLRSTSPRRGSLPREAEALRLRIKVSQDALKAFEQDHDRTTITMYLRVASTIEVASGRLLRKAHCADPSRKPGSCMQAQL